MKKTLPFLLLLLVFHCLNAADPIYAINYFDGLSYNNNIVTPSTSTIYLLSDSVNVITAKETSLYYWPLTSEYKADWATTNKTLSGSVIITLKQGEEVIIEAQPYVIQYDANNMRDTIKLYWNDEARNAYKEFTNLQDSYIDALYEYRIAEQKYSKQVDAFFMNMDENNDSSLFPVAPIPPPSFSLLSTEIHFGYPVELQEGSYTISFMTEDREIVDELTKKIVSFAPISLDTGYKVFEENKWTVPSFFPDSHNTLYTTSNAKLYAEPQLFSQYESKKYNLLINPQDSFYTQNDYFIWKTHGYYDESFLTLLDSSIPIKGYKVVQIAGSKLGYEMREVPLNQVGNSFNAALLDVNTLEDRKSYRVGRTSQIVLLRLFPSLPFLMITLALFPIIGAIVFAFIKIILKKRKTNEFYS